MAIFNQGILLIILHAVLVLASFMRISNPKLMLPASNPIPIHQRLDWPELMSIFSTPQASLKLKKIKPLEENLGFELNLVGRYQDFQAWLNHLSHTYPHVHWSHIRLQQNNVLNIQLQGKQDA